MKWKEKVLRKCISNNCNALIKDKGTRWVVFSKVIFWDSYCGAVRREELETNKKKADLHRGGKCCQTTLHVVEKLS